MNPILKAIDTLLDDQEQRHAWMLEAGEQIRRWKEEELAAVSGSEAWLPIDGYETLYAVSDQGRVKSVRSGRVMSPVLDGHGYPTVRLSRAGISTRFFIHRLVAAAFHHDKMNVLHKEVAHLDGSRTNCAASNLKWVSRAENCSHKRVHGTHQAGEKHPRAKLTPEQVVAIRASNESNCALARSFGVRDAAISKIRKGERWRETDQARSGLGASRFDPGRKEDARD